MVRKYAGISILKTTPAYGGYLKVSILLMLTATYLDSVMKKKVVDSSPNNITDIQFVAILHCSAHTPTPRNEQYMHIKSGSGLRRGGLSYVH